MIKTKSVLFIIVLFLIHPGCLARYGEGRLDQLLLSINDLKSECENNNEKLTEEKIKKKLGRPGWLKPVYEHNLDLSLLDKLKKDSGILLQSNPQDLYDVILRDINGGRLKNIILLSYVYDRMGHDDPSLTFYIGDYTDTSNSTHNVIGWDYVKYNHSHRNSGKKRGKIFLSYKIENPVDYFRLSYIFLVDVIIGLKQFAGEILKSPISFIETELFENIFIEKKIPFYKFEGFKSAIEDWRNGVTALTYRYRVDGKQGILVATQNLLGEVPIIGSLLDQWYKKESNNAKKLFVTRGIHGGDNSEQNMALWVNFLSNNKKLTHTSDYVSRVEVMSKDKAVEKETNDLFVKVIPYRHGNVIDVIWSLLNISHGFAYDMASEMVINDNVNPGDSIMLSGHSGGVQRIVSTARILNDDGINVEKMYGIAGPALGYAPCNKIKVELNGKILQDPTSDVSRLLNCLTFNLLANIKWEHKNDVDKRHKHRTPGFIDGRTRLKYDGFLGDRLKGFFR
ncbi:MAG: hypothetical protein ACE5KZ_08075 [Candidatus Scalinduaceae bacterium]